MGHSITRGDVGSRRASVSPRKGLRALSASVGARGASSQVSVPNLRKSSIKGYISADMLDLACTVLAML